MKKKLFKSLSALMILTMGLTVGCGGKEEDKAGGASADDGKVYEFDCGMVTPAAHQTTLSMQKFAELVKEKTDGKVVITVFADGQLGGERELLEGVQMGTVDMTSVTTTILANAVPEYLVFDMPFIFANDDEVYNYFGGEDGTALLKSLESKKMVGIGYLNNGFRVTTSNKPVRSVEDVKDLSIRTMENDIHQSTWKALGAQPTPMAFTDLFTALQQGVIDAQENPVSVIASAGFYEIQKYVSMTNHINSMTVTVFSKDKWDSLPTEYQDIIMEVQKEVEALDREAKKAANEADLAKMVDAGMEVVPSDEIDLKAFQAAVQPVYDQYAEQVGQELLDSLLKK